MSQRATVPDASPQPWWQEITSPQRKALIAATLGWVLDSMDLLLYAIVLVHLIEHFGMSFAMGGFLNSLTLMSSAIGGVAFGLIADRLGRVRAMMMSILVYSIFTAACGFSQTITQLAIFRIFLGLGVGGEWSTGAALISETWPPKHRGKAFGIMQKRVRRRIRRWRRLWRPLFCRYGVGVQSFSWVCFRRCSPSGYAGTSRSQRHG